jgi:LuxR family maltose regulon positive regulatory protein
MWRRSALQPRHGKTLLLAGWSRSSTAMDSAWVGVDQDDNDPMRVVIVGRGRDRRLSDGAARQPVARRMGLPARCRPEFIAELPTLCRPYRIPSA